MPKRPFERPAAAVLAFAIAALAAAPASAGAKEEKRKAKLLYANDLGPDRIDVSRYPKEMRETYAGAFQKCSKCHSLARPLNSEFVEARGKDLERLREALPESEATAELLRVGPDLWKRYVRRMMAKPGCEISPEEGKAIWKLLVFDSLRRKTGESLERWLRHRRGLLRKLKAEDPERYEELYGDFEERGEGGHGKDSRHGKEAERGGEGKKGH